MFDASIMGNLKVTCLNLNGLGTAITNSGTVSLNNVEFSGASFQVASTGTVNMSGMVVITKINRGSTGGENRID